MIIVLDAEVLVANAIIEGEVRGQLELILGIAGPIVVSIGARKGRLGDRQGDAARRILSQNAGCTDYSRRAPRRWD